MPEAFGGIGMQSSVTSLQQEQCTDSCAYLLVIRYLRNHAAIGRQLLAPCMRVEAGQRAGQRVRQPVQLSQRRWRSSRTSYAA